MEEKRTWDFYLKGEVSKRRMLS